MNHSLLKLRSEHIACVTVQLWCIIHSVHLFDVPLCNLLFLVELYQVKWVLHWAKDFKYLKIEETL